MHFQVWARTYSLSCSFDLVLALKYQASLAVFDPVGATNCINGVNTANLNIRAMKSSI